MLTVGVEKVGELFLKAPHSHVNELAVWFTVSQCVIKSVVAVPSCYFRLQ